jgi:hypothetical protein
MGIHSDPERQAIASMVNARLSLLDPAFLAWSGHRAVADWWTTTLTGEVARCTDLDQANAQAEMIGLGRPEDYLHKLIRVDRGTALVGIRFFGGDPTKPFVDLLGWTERVADLEAASHAALDALSCFSPSRCRVFLSSPPLDATQGRWHRDQVLLAQRIEEIARRGPRGATLEPCDEHAAARFVNHCYRDRLARRPELDGLLFPADAAELAECRNDGYLGRFITALFIKGVWSECPRREWAKAIIVSVLEKIGRERSQTMLAAFIYRFRGLRRAAVDRRSWVLGGAGRDRGHRAARRFAYTLDPFSDDDGRSLKRFLRSWRSRDGEFKPRRSRHR